MAHESVSDFFLAFDGLRAFAIVSVQMMACSSHSPHTSLSASHISPSVA